MRKAMWILAVVALVAVIPANAGSGEIGVDLGHTDFDSNVTDESGTEYAVRGGWHFTKLFEVEGQYGDSSADAATGDVSLSRLMVNAVFNFHPTPSIQPYCLGGIGQARMEFDSPLGSVDDSGNAYQLALGSRFLFGAEKRAGVRVEVSTVSEESFDETSRHMNLNVGFTWQIGS
jgi:opacity protein-like surface antigen